jgi:hypothetical protein
MKASSSFFAVGGSISDSGAPVICLATRHTPEPRLFARETRQVEPEVTQSAALVHSVVSSRRTYPAHGPAGWRRRLHVLAHMAVLSRIPEAAHWESTMGSTYRVTLRMNRWVTARVAVPKADRVTPWVTPGVTPRLTRGLTPRLTPGLTPGLGPWVTFPVTPGITGRLTELVTRPVTPGLLPRLLSHTGR